MAEIPNAAADPGLPGELGRVSEPVGQWQRRHEFRRLQLGCNRSPDSMLFRFMNGFSDTILDFAVWRLVVDAGACQAFDASWHSESSSLGVPDDFFPEYRAPL